MYRSRNQTASSRVPISQKGHCKETYTKFSAKVPELAEDSFLENIKQFYADLFNEKLKTNEFTVYNEEASLGIKMQSETKGLSEEQLTDIREKNQLKREYIDTYNEAIDIAYEMEDKKSITTIESMRDELKNAVKTDEKDYVSYFELMKSQLQQLLQLLERLLELYEDFKKEIKTNLNELVELASERVTANSSHNAPKSRTKSLER